MTAQKKKAFKNILTRAGKTFIQAFLSYLSIDSFFGISDFGALRRILLSVLVGALASGISAIWNSFIEWLTVRIEELDDIELGEELAEKLGEDDG